MASGKKECTTGKNLDLDSAGYEKVLDMQTFLAHYVKTSAVEFQWLLARISVVTFLNIDSM